MKKVQTSIFLAAFALGAVALSHATTGSDGSSITASDLSRDLSSVARMAGATEVSRRLMTTELGKSGEVPLTESGAVSILRRAGFAATTSNLDRLLTREQANMLVRQFRSSLAAAALKTGTALAKLDLPDTVDSCFDEKNHGLCVDCCKTLGGGASSCSKACMVINKPSASEPIP